MNMSETERLRKEAAQSYKRIAWLEAELKKKHYRTVDLDAELVESNRCWDAAETERVQAGAERDELYEALRLTGGDCDFTLPSGVSGNFTEWLADIRNRVRAERSRP